MVKDALQTLVKGERLIYLKEHLTKGNGFYRRSLVTPRGLISQRVRIPPVGCLLLAVALLQDTALW